eukprot:17925_1
MSSIIFKKRHYHNKNALWREIGFAVDEHDYDLITIISRHPLLVKRSQMIETIEHTVLHRFVEELQINSILQEYLSVDSEIKIDYLFKQLMLQKEKISESNVFWKLVGNTINNNEQFLSIVKKYSQNLT